MARILESVFIDGPAGKLEALHEGPEDGVAIDRVAVVCHPHPLHGGTLHNKVVFRLARGIRNAGSAVDATLLLSVREADDVLYARELETIGATVVKTYTRRPPAGWDGYARRVDRAMLEEVAAPGVHVYVCGPTTFVESVADDLVALGHAPANIRTERFGATGG